MNKKLLSLSLLVILSSCALFKRVRQSDLDSWKGQPVSKLDSHPFFISVPLETRQAENGLQIRIYRNSAGIRSSIDCDSFGNCTGDANEVVCNNIFYIRNSIIEEYKVVGRCYTDDSLRPQTK